MSLRVCFVCLGNICRSPTAEGIFRKLVANAGLDAHFEIASAGTGDWHVGEPPDPRSVATARAHDVRVEGRASHFVSASFKRFDLVIAMDTENAANLRKMARNEEDLAKIRLLRDFDASVAPGSSVPDPYYGGADGFEEVFAICERGCAGLLEATRAAR